MFRPTIVALLALVVRPLFAGGPGGVVLDGSFGTSGALPGPSFMIPANVGKQVGGNLFHSFSQFDLNSTQSATFAGPTNVHNILSRVTSGSTSSIDGLVRSDIAGANLFLLNSSGVMFGPHAKIDVSGSFAVSTANYVKLASGGRFNASLGGQDVLTSAPVTAFGFLNSAPAPVSVINSRLNVAPTKCFSIVAGDIAVNGGAISGQGSRANLVSVKSAGEVQLDITDFDSSIGITQFTGLGVISLINSAKIDTSGSRGGPVVIRGGNLLLENSQILSDMNGSVQGGDIDIAVTESMTIKSRGSISTDSSGPGKSGDIAVSAGSLLIDGNGFSNFPTGIFTELSGQGPAGNISVHTRDLSITATGVIFSNTLAKFPLGRGGNLIIVASNSLTLSDGGIGSTENVDVMAGSLTINNFGGIGSVLADVRVTAESLLINGGSISAGGLEFANAGNIMIQVRGALTIIHGAISASGDLGTGGNITVSTDSLLIEGAFSGIFSEGGFTNGGNVAVQAQDIKINDGGRISISTSGFGTGSISLVADSILITGKSQFSSSGLFAETFGFGNAGSIEIRARDLRITGGGAISSASTGEQDQSGQAGNVFINTTGSVRLENGSSVSTSAVAGGGGSIDITTPDLVYLTDSSITATVGGQSIFGLGGTITISANNLLLQNGAQISSSTFGQDKGGSVNVLADLVLIDGGSSNLHTGISANAEPGSSGGGGSVFVQAGDLTISGGGQISSSTLGYGNGGNLMVMTTGSLFIRGEGSGIFADTGAFDNDLVVGSGDAGNIAVQTGNLTITGGGEISATTFNTGKAGSISIDANLLLLSGGSISSDTPNFLISGAGDAGEINVSADSLKIIAGGAISSSTRSGGRAGDVYVTAHSLLIDGALSVSGIFAIAIGVMESFDARGEAGNISVKASDINILNGGLISTESAGTSGGDIDVTCDSLVISGVAVSAYGFRTPAGIFADAIGNFDDPRNGSGGNIAVRAGDVTITGGGQISANSLGGLKGGDITVITNSLLLDGTIEFIYADEIQRISSGIFAESNLGPVGTGSGPAGNIEIRAMGPIKLKHGASISTSSQMGDAGSIDIVSGGEIRLSDQSSITVSAGADGGDIHIATPDLVYLTDSSITATASSTSAGGIGGNVTIEHPEFILLNGSSISANAAAGQGGNINLISDFFFNSDSSITATGTTNNGTVNITAPDLDLSASLITLPSSLLSAETQLREGCTIKLRGDFSSFVSVGRGGTETAPDELQVEF